jgi:hypothetical protein
VVRARSALRVTLIKVTVHAPPNLGNLGLGSLRLAVAVVAELSAAILAVDFVHVSMIGHKPLPAQPLSKEMFYPLGGKALSGYQYSFGNRGRPRASSSYSRLKSSDRYEKS